MNMFIMRCIVGCRAVSFSSFAHHNRQPQHQQKLLLSADSTWFASPNIINSCETFHMLIVIKQHELQTNKIIIIHFSVWNTYLAGGESNSLRDMVNVDLKLNRPYQRANIYEKIDWPSNARCFHTNFEDFCSSHLRVWKVKSNTTHCQRM